MLSAEDNFQMTETPSDDQRGSAKYKKAMVKVWARRKLAACLT